MYMSQPQEALTAGLDSAALGRRRRPGAVGLQATAVGVSFLVDEWLVAPALHAAAWGCLSLLTLGIPLGHAVALLGEEWGGLLSSQCLPWAL